MGYNQSRLQGIDIANCRLNVTNLSPALLLAWDLAATEAATANRSLIDPEHLMLGLLRLADFETHETLTELGYQTDEARAIVPEVRRLMGIFAALKLDPVLLRRDLRERKTGKLPLMGWNTGPLPRRTIDREPPKVLHRSTESRLVFTYADELTRRADVNGLTTLVHLLWALLKSPHSHVGAWLRAQHVDVEALLATTQAALEPTSGN